MLQQKGLQGLLLALGLLFGVAAQALTLGDMVVHSRPGQPLRASIPLSLADEESLAQIRVTLASAEQYAAQQLERPPFLEGMRLALLDKGEGHVRIELYGEQPWPGEAAVLLLQLVWPQGQVTERFRLAGVAPADEQGETTPRYVEVGENETLDAIAIRLSRGSNRSYLHMMYALFTANPGAFYRGNMNNLKHGARLRVPTEAELYQLSDGEVFRGIREQYAQWQQQRESQGEVSGAGAALAGMSDEEAAALALGKSPEALQAQLQSLTEENEAIQRRNAELKTRLARLEQQMQQMTEQVLEYPVSQPLSEAKAEPSPAEEQAEATKPQTKEVEGLPDSLLALLMLLALGAGVVVWRYATRAPRGGR